MHINYMRARLSDLGIKYVDLPMPTLRRWAAEGIVTPPMRYSKGKGGGRGRVSYWSDRSLEEAAACWYVRNKISTLIPPSVKVLQKVKLLALALYDPRSLAIVQSKELYPLVEKWICVVEKVRHNWSVNKPARITILWSSKEESEWDSMFEEDDVIERDRFVLEDVTVEDVHSPLEEEFKIRDAAFMTLFERTFKSIKAPVPIHAIFEYDEHVSKMMRTLGNDCERDFDSLKNGKNFGYMRFERENRASKSIETDKLVFRFDGIDQALIGSGHMFELD